MLRVGICDDEAYFVDALAEQVSAFFAGESLEMGLFRFSSGRELLDQGGGLDILFLDICMDGPDGLETARELRRRQFGGILIFVTVLEDCVFDAFGVQAYDYLVKPLQPQGLQRTLARLVGTLRAQGSGRLLVRQGGAWQVIPFDRIVFCEVIDRKVYLHLRDGRVVDYYERLEILSEKLDSRFFRCHRSYLVNLQYVERYEEGAAQLAGGARIPVSRLRSSAFSGAVMQYLKLWGNRV